MEHPDKQDEEEEASTPFWVQSTSKTRTGRLRSRLSSLLFSSGSVVFVLLVTSVFFLIFILPSTLSFTSQVFRPNSIKKSWDSLNILLVLVAVAFAFLSRIKNEDYDSQSSSTPNKLDESVKPKPDPNGGFRSWYDDVQHKDSFLKRNTSSYPDLRQFSSNQWNYDPYQRGFYDDLSIKTSRVADPVNRQRQHRRHRSVEEIDILRAVPKEAALVLNQSKQEEESTVVADPPNRTRMEQIQQIQTLRVAPKVSKTAVVDTLLAKEGEKDTIVSNPLAANHRRHRSVEQIHRVAPKEDIDSPKEDEDSNVSYPRPPANVRHRRYRSVEEIDTLRPLPKTSTTPTPTPMFVDTLVANRSKTPGNGNQERIVRRRKVRTRKSSESLKEEDDSVDRPGNSTNIVESRPIHRSPDTYESDSGQSSNVTNPPPRPSNIKRRGSATKEFFNSLVHKKNKKKSLSVDSVPPISHEPLSNQSRHVPVDHTHTLPSSSSSSSAGIQNLFLSKKQNRKRTISVPFTPPQPNKPPPASGNIRDRFEEIGESPSRIPPPPPPPPPAFLKSPAWKFVVQGDYVKVDSDSDVTPSADEASASATPFHPSPLYCPSPDVNSKAESFITNFRAKLKLEKNRSINGGAQLGLSGLGPGPGPTMN